MVEGIDGEGPAVTAHGPGRFLGEIGLITGEASFLTAVRARPGRGARRPRFAGSRARDPRCRARRPHPARAYLLRRTELIETGVGFRIIGSHHSTQTRKLREFATRNRLPHRVVDVEEDQKADTLLRQLGVGPEETPIVICGGGTVLRNPSIAEVARAVGLPVPRARHTDFDLMIVGAGPAGLAAAVYGASEGLHTACLDTIATGGQAGTSSHIENYLGFPAGISGGELAERAVIQATKFGAEINVPGEVRALDDADGHWLVRLDDGTELSSCAVVIATGASYRRLPLPDADRFEGVSIFHAATLSEAQAVLARAVRGGRGRQLSGPGVDLPRRIRGAGASPRPRR